MGIGVCVSLLVVYGPLYFVVSDCQLNVEERQFKFTDVNWRAGWKLQT